MLDEDVCDAEYRLGFCRIDRMRDGLVGARARTVRERDGDRGG
jgi:hypothetical protein